MRTSSNWRESHWLVYSLLFKRASMFDSINSWTRVFRNAAAKRGSVESYDASTTRVIPEARALRLLAAAWTASDSSEGLGSGSGALRQSEKRLVLTFGSGKRSFNLLRTRLMR